MIRSTAYSFLLATLITPTFALAEESEIAQAWRDFFVGDWSRVSVVEMGREKTEQETSWTCERVGAAIIARGELVKGGTYVAMMAWNGYSESLLEVGRSTSGESWTVHFKPKPGKTLKGEATGALPDGRTGKGECTITRTDADSYEAVFELKLNDGSAFRVKDVNKRKSAELGLRFGNPVPLSDALNQGSTWEQSVTGDGLSLFFASNRQGSRGFDIYVATRETKDATWGSVKNLGEGINSPEFEGWPSISSDGLELFFTSSRKSRNELFVVRRAKTTDSWGKPKGLGVQGGTPDISPCGRYLFFTNTPNWDGQGEFDIFVMKRENRAEPFGDPVRLGTPINSETDDFSPNVSEDGKTLTYYSKGKLWRVALTLPAVD